MRNKSKGKGQRAKGKGILIFAFGLWLFAFPNSGHADRSHTCGFEEGEAASGITIWNVLGGSGVNIVTTPVYSGTYAMRANRITSGTASLRRDLAAADTTGTYCQQMRLRRATGTPSAATIVHQVRSSTSTDAWQISVDTSNVLSLINANDASSITGPTLTIDTWYQVESCVLLSTTVGTLELKVDGVSQGTLTGKNTLPTNVNYFYWGIFNTVVTADFYFDDIVLNTELGTVFNSWPNGERIALLKPASDNTVLWTKTGANCSGTTNTDCVDDQPGTPDDASGYTMSATANQEDRLNVGTLPAEVPSDADMLVLDVYYRWGGNGNTGTREGRTLIWDEASVQTNGPTHNRCDFAAGTWNIATTANHQVFDLGARSKANVEAFDLGYEPLNSAECRVTSLWGNVGWKAASATRNRVVVIE